MNFYHKGAVLLLAYVFVRVDSAALGATCSVDSDCTPEFSRCLTYEGCTNGKCACEHGYKPTDPNTCKAVVDVGASCSRSATYPYGNCGQGAQCTSNVCTCLSGYTVDDDGDDCEWSTQVAFDATCSDSRDCQELTKRAGCIGSKCACSTGFRKSGDECVVVDYGSSCSDSVSCLDFLNLQCTSGTCTCDPSTYTARTIHAGGMSGSVCLPTSVTTDLGEGSTCSSDTPFTASSKFCADGLVCTTCPGTTSTRVCAEPPGNAAVMATMSVYLALLTAVCLVLFA